MTLGRAQIISNVKRCENQHIQTEGVVWFSGKPPPCDPSDLQFETQGQQHFYFCHIIICTLFVGLLRGLLVCLVWLSLGPSSWAAGWFGSWACAIVLRHETSLGRWDPRKTHWLQWDPHRHVDRMSWWDTR